MILLNYQTVAGLFDGENLLYDARDAAAGCTSFSF